MKADHTLQRALGVAVVIRQLLRAALLILVFDASDVVAQDLQRGLRNYQEVVGGKRKLEQLSPQEQQEVLIIHRRIQARRAQTSGSSECRSARTRAASAASELADYARRLRNCAEAEDYSDDCSSEFRRVRNAHSDYEDAVSSVSSSCR